MYERFDEPTRQASRAVRAFAKARTDPFVHTGHLLYGLLVTGAIREISCLAAIPDGPARIEGALAGPLPDGLEGERPGAGESSEAYCTTCADCVMRTRRRDSQTITVRDALGAIVASGPNVATYLLGRLAVDQDALGRELEDHAEYR